MAKTRGKGTKNKTKLLNFIKQTNDAVYKRIIASNTNGSPSAQPNK